MSFGDFARVTIGLVLWLVALMTPHDFLTTILGLLLGYFALEIVALIRR